MKKMIIILVILIIALVALFIVFNVRSQDYEKRVLRVNDVEIQVEVADTIPKQVQGLSGRESLCFKCGMIFPYEAPRIQTFTMRGMKFSLDMIFIRDGEVVEIHEDIPHPDRAGRTVNVRTQEEADLVLEVEAGFVRNHRLSIGDLVREL